MKTLDIFLIITLIELVIIILNILRYKKQKTRGSKLDLFFVRMYENYKGMLLILGIIISITNLIGASIIHILINIIQHIIK